MSPREIAAKLVRSGAAPKIARMPERNGPMFAGRGGAGTPGEVVEVPTATDPDGPTIFIALAKLGLKLQQTRGPVEVIVIDHSEAVSSPGMQIMCAAMQRQGLNPPKLAVRILTILRRTKQTKAKVDRTTVFRIMRGETKRPQPEIRNALIEALELASDEATIVRTELGGGAR